MVNVASITVIGLPSVNAEELLIMAKNAIPPTEKLDIRLSNPKPEDTWVRGHGNFLM